MTHPAASFRDPAGSCGLVDGRILRVLDEGNAADFGAFLRTPSAQRFAAQQQLVSTRRLPESEVAALLESPHLWALLAARPAEAVFEHDRILFPSYPYEWPPEMLWEAGRLTLELARGCLADGYGLKDATPYNVLFRGCRPIFIDVGSFTPRLAGDPVWRPYGQFVRTFLLPLLVNQHWGFPVGDVFRTRRDGLKPQEVYRLCGPLERLKPQILSLVSMPTWLAGKARAEGEKLYEPRTLANAEKARVILQSLLKRLQRSLESLKPATGKDSAWSEYMGNHSYSEPAFAAKEQFIDKVLEEFKPKRVLDAGANTGHFSVRSARAGAEVVAIDADPVCMGLLWRGASAQGLNILPLVVDLSRPTPALGWRYRECWSFLGRATGAFDCVLMLALIHHLLINERIPLEEILGLASELTTSLLVVEFVAPTDEMFRELARGREKLHDHLDEPVFEEACTQHFDIVRSLPLPDTHRRLYLLRKKGGRG